jgi:hypothetical protein
MHVFVRRIRAAVGAALLLVTLGTTAQVPNLINYQGFVAVGGASFTGSGQFRFAFVDPAGTTTFWSNDGTSVGGSQPAAAVTLAVSGGVFSAVLGDTSVVNMTAIPATVFTANSDVRLRVWFDDATNGIQHLVPDQRIVAGAYAIRAGSADALAASASVPAVQITGTVTNAQIADGSVTKPKLSAPGGSAGQVLGTDGSNLQWQGAGGGGTVTQVNTGTGLTGGPINTTGTVSIAAGGVSANELAANAVTAPAIAANAVTTTAISNANVTQSKLSAAGGSNGQLLSTDGTNLVWTSTQTQVFRGLISNVAGSSAVFVFIGPTVAQVLNTGDRVLVAASGGLGFSPAGADVQIDLDVCYRLGAGAVTSLGLNYITAFVSASRKIYAVNNIMSGLAAGSYTFGMCARNSTATTLNANDWAQGYLIVIK